MSEDVSKVRQKVETKFTEFESRHREMREQQNEMRQEQSTIKKQQDEIKNQQDELKTDVRTISTAVRGLAGTIEDNWKDMSDQNRLMQKTLLGQMEKLLSRTDERDETREQEQARVRDRAKENQADLSTVKPVKSLDLGDAVPTVHNVTNDASIVQEIMEETINRFEKLISG